MEKRILILGTFASTWGGSRGICEDLAERLHQRGWLVLSASSQRGRIARVMDMAATILKSRNSYSLAQVDVYSGTAFWWAAMNVFLLRILKKPVILSLHGGGLPDFARRRPEAVRWLLSSARAVTAPSAYLASAMKPYHASISVISNGMDLAAYPFRLRDNPQPNLIWVRAFHRVYNPALAPAVLAIVHKTHPDARLVMLGADKGDGSLSEARDAADQLGVSEHVTFPGFVPKHQVPQWLDQSDIFLNTTNVDNAPVSVLEAMACGLCIVSTNAGGLTHLLTDGKNALLSPAEDANAMASNILTILDHTETSTRLSRQAHEHAGKYDWTTILDAWEQLIRTIEE